MSTPLLDPILSSAIENELANLGTRNSQLQRRQRRARGTAAIIGTVSLAGLITGGAIIINQLPSETTTTPLGTIVTGTYTGTASVDLGDAPAGADAVVLDVTCSGDGTISIPLNGSSGGDSVYWDCGLRTGSTHIADGKLPDPGSTSITITADPGATWTVNAQYATESTTPWGVNSNGQTYGVPHNGESPDLLAAQATNGEIGYIVTDELLTGLPDRDINVYNSDGTTVIGKFHIGNS